MPDLSSRRIPVIWALTWFSPSSLASPNGKARQREPAHRNSPLTRLTQATRRDGAVGDIRVLVLVVEGPPAPPALRVLPHLCCGKPLSLMPIARSLVVSVEKPEASLQLFLCHEPHGKNVIDERVESPQFSRDMPSNGFRSTNPPTHGLSIAWGDEGKLVTSRL